MRVDSSPVALLALWLASSASRKRSGSLFISRRVRVEINSFRRKGKQIKDVICSEEPQVQLFVVYLKGENNTNKTLPTAASMLITKAAYFFSIFVSWFFFFPSAAFEDF